MQETLEDPPSTVTFSKTSIRTCTQSDFDDTQSTLIYTARAWCTLPNTVDPGETIGVDSYLRCFEPEKSNNGLTRK